MSDFKKTPRLVRASRARVWQEEWEPVPWDYSRRTVCTETADQTYSSREEREKHWREAKLQKYRRYQVHYYGSPTEKEMANCQLRGYLKQQQELIEPPYKLFVRSVGESKDIAWKVLREELQDLERNRQHRLYMTTFRDGNKSVIEHNLLRNKEQRLQETRQEQRRLSLNPINWNHTLW